RSGPAGCDRWHSFAARIPGWPVGRSRGQVGPMGPIQLLPAPNSPRSPARPLALRSPHPLQLLGDTSPTMRVAGLAPLPHDHDFYILVSLLINPVTNLP